jgi:hypothetical protein
MAECAEWDAKGTTFRRHRRGVESTGIGRERSSARHLAHRGPGSQSRPHFHWQGGGQLLSCAAVHEGEGRRDEAKPERGSRRRGTKPASRLTVRHMDQANATDVVASPYRRSTMFRSRSSCRQRSIARRQSCEDGPSCNRNRPVDAKPPRARAAPFIGGRSITRRDTDRA